MNLNTQNNHPLIPREQNYIVDRKLLTVHSEDRDYSKWPKANHFEIILPESYTNIQSMRLVEISLPCNYYTFSNYNQNTKLSFKINPQDPTDLFYDTLNTYYDNFSITIQEGYYTPDEFALEIQNKMNYEITNFIGTTYDRFRVFYDKVAQKIWFGNTTDKFELTFDNKIIYDLPPCEQANIWCQYTKWGLPSYIGFNKETYTSESSNTPITFDYLDNNVWLDPSGSDVWYVKAPLTINILGEKAIYMEVDKYNSYDELYPYSEATSNVYGNDYGGRVKSAFAKIPITSFPNGHGDYGMVFDSRNASLQNVTQFLPPLERIQKFKFKFRYHDGRLVDFHEIPFNFTIEINQLKNEILKKCNIRMPALYNL